MNHKAKWLKVIYWIRDNFSEPVWEEQVDSSGARKDKMTFYILNKPHKPDTTENKITARRFQYWYTYNEEYLPTDLRGLMKPFWHQGDGNPDNLSDETKEALRWFDVWMQNMYVKIQMDLSQKYYKSGCKRHFDILERRFRTDWGINKETKVETKKTSDSEEITVKFTEA